jgi:benzoylformate decarboxylase
VQDLGRTYVTKLSVVGDIKVSLCALLPHLQKETDTQRQTYAELNTKAKENRAAQRSALLSLSDAQFNEPVVTPLVAAREAVRAIGPKVSIVDEAIATSAHVRKFLNSESANQYSFMRGGGLGWGMPAAVGCSLGLGREPVVCLVGDGAALYSPQALWTAAHEKLPVTFVVMNNREYNVLKNFMRSQEHFVSAQTNKFIAMEIDQPAIDYVALAQGFGLPARRVQKATDIAAGIEAGIASGRANLIEVTICAS